jgi:spore coat polysaccharide biosynthesis protein SpsF (cytidylyltransferase family)
MERPLDTLIITQARMGSTRLPGKILMKIQDEELLKIHLKRISRSRLADLIIVATTSNPIDDIVDQRVSDWGFKVYRGSEDDVLDRFYRAARAFSPKWVVRVTSDCPLLDPNLIDALIAFGKVHDVDYCANIIIENYPDGQDVEVFKFSALEKAWKEAVLNSDREHVTPYIRNNSDLKNGKIFHALNFPATADYSKIRMTVDEQRDYNLVEKLINELGADKSWLEYTRFIAEKSLSSLNEGIIRNEGYLKSLKRD